MKSLLIIAVCFAVVGSGTVCLAQTELVNDNFDSGTTGTYLGPNWTGCGFFLGTYNKLAYQNGQAGGGGYYSQECALYTGYGVFPADQYATATVVSPNPASTSQAGVQLRQSAVPSNPESYIACGWNAQDFPADYHYRIWSMAPNPPTGGPSSLFLSNVTPATNDVIWCQVLGNTITMKVNGNILATVTDTSGILSGYPGLYYVDPNGGAPPSNDVIWDNFAAGSGPALTSLTITPSSISATEGSFQQFTGTATYADGTTESLSHWSSSDTTVATVDSSGFAYAASPGTVTVTGSTGVDSGTATLTVNPSQGYTPLVDDPFVGTTGSYLSATNWTGCGYYGGAYSPLVYQNNQAGGGGYYSQECAVYTGFGAFPNDQYATATVVSSNPASTPQAGVQLRQNVTASTPEYYIACGWNAQDFPADYHYRIWSMQPDPPTGGPTSLYLSNVMPATNDVVWCQVMGNTVNMQVNGTTIATVTDNSGVTSGYPGLYYIDPNGDVPPPTDIIWDNFVAGRIDSAVLTSITVTPNPAAVGYGGNLQFTATGTYTDGSTGNITNSAAWSSSNSSIATVSSGLAYGANPGTVTITAASGTASGRATLTVNPPVAPTVSFSAPSSAPYYGTFTVTATTNAPVMPTISGTAGVCSVGAVTGTPANANAVVTMLVSTGTCTTTASWAAGGGYAAAGPISRNTSATKGVSTTTITSSTPNPSSLNQAVQINFTVTGGGVAPTGSVTVSASTRESCTGTLNSGAGSCSITFSTAGARTLTARYAGDTNYNSGTSTGVTQTVNQPIVSLSQQNINYGNVSRGNTQTKSETVTNTGTAPLLNFTWTITGLNASDFFVSSTTCGTAPATLNAGASCVLNVTFRPTATGTRTANLRLTDNAANSPQNVGLSGSGK